MDPTKNMEYYCMLEIFGWHGDTYKSIQIKIKFCSNSVWVFYQKKLQKTKLKQD